jgi:predicted Zn-dependent peptidase
VLGAEATLANVGVDTLKAFHDAHMTPDRVVISIAGAYDREAFLDTAAKRFAHLNGRPALECAPARPLPGQASETRKLEQTHLVFSWPAPAAGADELFAARLLSEIFGGGMSSRLFQEVREARGLVYAIDSFLETFEDDGRLTVYAGCSARHARTVAEIVRDELALLADKGPSLAELARAKAVARAQMLMGLEAPSARAEARVGQVLVHDRLVSFDELRARLEAVTAEEVQALASKALHGPAAAAAIGPRAGHGALEAFQANC